MDRHMRESLDRWLTTPPDQDLDETPENLLEPEDMDDDGEVITLDFQPE